MPRGVYPHTHVRKKVYDPEIVESVRSQYHDHGYTKAEVAAILGLTTKVVERIMINHSIPARRAVKRHQAGPANSAWKGNGATYTAFHSRVYRTRTKTGICTRCHAPSKTEWANLTGRYEHTDDYAEMCRSCHRRYDHARTGQGGDAL
jgi:predicted CXXCH cytochrome family protein